MSTTQLAQPLIAHVLYRFDVGGLENGVVNLINNMPADKYRHAVIALDDVTEFRQRLRRADVEVIALKKNPGHGVKLYPRLFRLFRELRPAIVHTRNLAALEAVIPAWAAGVPVRIHGEHGRDLDDLDGSSRKYRWIRRVYRPFVNRYIALSRDLEGYLTTAIGIPERCVTQIYNGVDARRFKPREQARVAIDGYPFNDPLLWTVGTVGRMAHVKDQLTLARAFVRALETDRALQERLRLVMIGDGPLRAQCAAILEQAGLSTHAWLPGTRDDVADVLRRLDCFVLPSLAEGISNTILEAMATGLPVIATNVGGNSELIAHDQTGELVPAGDDEALARQILACARDPERARAFGRGGRLRVERLFSLEAMVEQYTNLYDRELGCSAPHLQRASVSS